MIPTASTSLADGHLWGRYALQQAGAGAGRVRILAAALIGNAIKEMIVSLKCIFTMVMLVLIYSVLSIDNRPASSLVVTY